MEEIIVYGSDKVGLLETTPTDRLFGIVKPLTETPRAATFVSKQTLQRYGVEQVDDLTAITPGAFTASYFGVRGAVNLRGTIAENYFRGFKRIENRGTYQTPLTALESIEILRGPPTVMFGSGKIGGFLNVTPQTARAASGQLEQDTFGDLEVTLGNFGRFNAAGNVTVPLQLGDIAGGVHLFAEREDSDNFYRGISPEHTLIQMAADFDLSSRTRLSIAGMYYDADGYIQTPGWNRLTQDLIDNRQYITGRNTALIDTDGDGRLSIGEAGGSFVAGFFGFQPPVNDRFRLDEGVGTARLSQRTVFVSDADFSETRTDTFFAEVQHDISEDVQLRVQGFYDSLDNKRFVSYGFPADYDSRVFELRSTLEFPLKSEALAMESTHVVGAAYRDFKGKRRENFEGGFISLDRRDILRGPTATDIFDDPFRNPDIAWELENRSDWNYRAVFLQSDVTFAERINVMLGLRNDWYDLDANNTGSRGGAAPMASASDSDLTWNVSVGWLTGTGLFPYVTIAESSTLEVSQAGDVTPGLINGDQWLAESDLKEVGVKFDLLDGTLVGGVAYYDQTRTRLSTPDRAVSTTGRGYELEARWLIDDNFSLTLAANRQKTTINGPDTAFTYVPPYAIFDDPTLGLGGAYAIFNFAASPLGFPGDYRLSTIPKVTASLYGSYISQPLDWGQFGATVGIIHTGETSTLIRDPVVFPSYEIVNGSLFATFGLNTVTVNVNNLFNKRYFQPAADVYANVSTLPGRGREWRVTFRRSF